MKKNLFVALSLFTMIFLSTNVYSQEDSTSRGGFQLGGYLPFGKGSDLVSLGIGGSVIYNYKFTDKIYFTGALGYYNFLKGDAILFETGKNMTVSGYYYTYYTYTIVPFLAGVQYDILPPYKTIQPYIGTELGFIVFRSHQEIHLENLSGIRDRDVINVHGTLAGDLCFAPAVGFRVKLGLDVVLDVNAKWNIATDDVRRLGLNIGVLFRR